MLRSYNPYTDETISQFIETNSEQIGPILENARAAQRKWAAQSVEKRMARLAQLPKLISNATNQVNNILVAEVGMPVTEAKRSTNNLVVRVDFLLSTTPQHLQSEERALDNGMRNRVCYDPLGTVACIMPWNHPFSIPFWSLVPALVAGNAVIYKPSELTPAVGKKLDELITTLDLPPGIFTTVLGDGTLGAELSKSDKVEAISFAGSVGVAKRIYQEAAMNIKRLVLENGGKDALIVGEVANISQVADQILIGALRHAGQLCSSVRRVYICERDYEQFVEQLVEKMPAYKTGNPELPDTVVGPLKTERQVKRLNEQVDDALSKGAKIAYGERSYSRRFSPLLLRDVDATMHIEREETFGPVVPLIKVKSVEEAIDRSNDSAYGLNSSIWHDAVDQAMDFASKVTVGTVTINSLPSTHNQCTWHGVKLSGLGNVLSPECVRQFTNRKNIRYTA